MNTCQKKFRTTRSWWCQSPRSARGCRRYFGSHLDQEKQPSFAASITWKRQTQAVWLWVEKVWSLKLSKRSANPPKTAFVFQHYNLFANKTAIENILGPDCGSEDSKKKKPSNLGRIRPWKKSASLAYKDYYPSQLSGGQQQRVKDCACHRSETRRDLAG